MPEPGLIRWRDCLLDMFKVHDQAFADEALQVQPVALA